MLQRASWSKRICSAWLIVAGAMIFTGGTVGGTTRGDVASGVVAKAADHRIIVSWNPVRSHGTTRPTYIVSTLPSGGSCTTKKLSCVIAPLDNGVRFAVTVRAVWGTQLGAPSLPVSVTPIAVPSPPTQVVVTPGDTAATITWLRPSDDGGSPITKYVAKATSGGQSCSSTGLTSCTMLGLHQGQSLSVRVTAYNAIGKSAESARSKPVGTGLGAVVSVTAKAGTSLSDVGTETISWRRLSRSLVTYTATSSDGLSSCQVIDASSCTARINGLKSVSFTVTARTTTAFGLPLSTLPSERTRALPLRVVVALAGQSNATGISAPGTNAGTIPLSTPADSQSSITWDPFPFMPAPKPGWLPLSTPQRALGSPAPSFGPEVGLARAVFAGTQVPLSIIKVTYGGTSLATGWNPGRTDGLYQEFLTFTKHQLMLDQASGVIDVLRAFVWFQGENDTLSASDSANYLTNLTALLDGVNAELPWAKGAKTALIAESSTAWLQQRAKAQLCGDPACTQEHLADDRIRAADANLAASRPEVELVDSLGYARGTDAVHLTAASELLIGQATARVLGGALGLPNSTKTPSRRGAHQ